MSKKSTPPISLLIAAASLVFSGSVFADGPVSITQAGAAAGGITAGDTPGFPVTISQPGAYRLDSNLSVAAAHTPGSAIVITANDVTLDLNGFAVDGGVRCSPGFDRGNSCTTSTFDYALVSSSGDRVTVKNGSIIGSSADGLAVANYGSVQGVKISMNRNWGLRCNAVSGSMNAKDVSITKNGQGAYLGCVANFTDADVSWNNGDGINSSLKGVYVNVTATNNTGAGVITGNSVIERSVSQLNGGVGFWGGSVVKDSVAQGNGDSGFKTQSNGTLSVNNSALDNAGKGFDFGNASSCYSNILASGNTGAQISGGTQLTGTKVSCP